MTRTKPGLLRAALLIAVAAATPALGQAVGVTTVVRNNVQITTPAKPAPHQAVPRETLALGNQVVTRAASMVQLLLLDRTSFTVGANARVKIDRFVYDPAKNASSVSASVATGAFRFMSSPSLHRGSEPSRINTPVASIGIRGTIVEGVVGAEAIRIANQEAGVPKPFKADPDTATLIVLRGPGRNAKGVAPGAIDIYVGDSVIPVEDAGLAVFIPGPGQAPIGPFMLSSRGIMWLRDLLGPRPLPAGGNDWQPDPTTDHEFECSGNVDVAGTAGCGGK